MARLGGLGERHFSSCLPVLPIEGWVREGDELASLRGSACAAALARLRGMVCAARKHGGSSRESPESHGGGLRAQAAGPRKHTAAVPEAYLNTGPVNHTVSPRWGWVEGEGNQRNTQKQCQRLRMRAEGVGDMASLANAAPSNVVRALFPL